MQNEVPASPGASRAVDRALERRRAIYEDEVRRLVAAGFELIRESGALEPRVSEIVGRAGLSNQAFYRHFRSKDELLLAVLEEGIAILEGYLRHRMEQAPDAESRVWAWLAGMLEQALDTEAAAATRPFALSRARLAELFPAEVEAAERRLTAMLQDALSGATGADPERDAETLYDLAMGWMQRRLAQPGRAQREDAEALTAFALHGIRRGGA
jgi:AcrR family transcriptional regulator